MTTQCETMMAQTVQRMIKQTIAHLDNNQMLKVSKEEAMDLFDIVKKKGRRGRPAVVIDEVHKAEKDALKATAKAEKKAEKDALKAVAKAEKEVANTEKEVTNAIAVINSRPRGRSPKGRVWDETGGAWVEQLTVE